MKKVAVCLSLDEDKLKKLKRISHEMSIKEEKDISYVDLVREAIDKVYFDDEK